MFTEIALANKAIAAVERLATAHEKIAHEMKRTNDIQDEGRKQLKEIAQNVYDLLSPEKKSQCEPNV